MNVHERNECFRRLDKLREAIAGDAMMVQIDLQDAFLEIVELLRIAFDEIPVEKAS